MSDFHPERIEAALRAEAIGLGVPLVFLPRTESTNDDAKRAAREGAPEGAAFVADVQTRGRGRRGHAWHSPAGENLYASFVLRPDLPVAETPPLSLVAGLAVVDAASRFVPSEGLRIKWPNDVYLDGRKLAGILVEGLIAGARSSAVVVGIGLNVHTRDFPEPLGETATSLALASQAPLDRSQVFVALCRALEERMREHLEHGIEHTVRALSRIDYLAGKAVKIEGEEGIAQGVAADGRLLVRTREGEERAYVAGEVSLGAVRG